MSTPTSGRAIDISGNAYEMFLGTSGQAAKLDGYASGAGRLLNSNLDPLAAAGYLGDERQIFQRARAQLLAKLQTKEDELAKAKAAFVDEFTKKDRDNAQLKAKQQEYEKKAQLGAILSSVEVAAQTCLLSDPSFEELFRARSCSAFVMSVDIRRSTDLMLKAVKPSEEMEDLLSQNWVLS